MAFRLICNDGTELRIPRDCWRKLSLFDEPEIVKAGCYRLQCRASHELVNVFLDCVEGVSDVTVTEKNFDDLKDLSRELGFSGLDKKLAAFGACQSVVTASVMKESIDDASRQYRAILKVLSIHQEFFLQFSSLAERVRVLEEQSERKATEMREYVERSVAQVKECIEGKVDATARVCEEKIAEASQKTEGVLSKCAKESDLENLACDVAQLKERENTKGDVLAEFMYGLRLEEGRGVLQNYEEAARYYKLAADQGNANAQVKYGKCLENGCGVGQNYEEAARYFKLAADQGRADMQMKYGECLEKGRGVGQNYQEAARYFKLAADQGNAEMQVKYGYCLEKGHGVGCNYQEAARYYKRAADQGNISGKRAYGECLKEGRGVPRNVSEGERYLKEVYDHYESERRREAQWQREILAGNPFW